MKCLLTKICILLFFFSTVSYSQTFQHIEEFAGLDELSHNNGIAIADYDQDEDLDILVVTKNKDVIGFESTYTKLYQNNGDGTFANVTVAAGLSNLLNTNELDSSYDNFGGLAGYKYGASWGDYDNDGYPDLFFTHLAKVQLFHNEGDGTFINVTQAAGIVERNECGNTGATWFDYNNDGNLDIYINDWAQCAYNTFYQNNGDGTFTDVSSIILEQDQQNLFSYTAFPFDFDGNGFMDLYVTNDKSTLNQLFLNLDGTQFTENALQYGVANNDNDMGVALSDYDKDDDFDIFITTIDRNFLFTNNGNNTFTDTAVQNHTNNTGWSWGTQFADYDLDGDEDLFIVNGFKVILEANVYLNNTQVNNEVIFEPLTTGLEDVGASVSTVDFDFDNDGDLDVLVTNSDRNSYFYMNQTILDPINTDKRWFKVSLQGTVSNRDAIGTTLILHTTQGDIRRYFSGVGFLGQSLKPVHFGLESDASINSLEIHWPSGLVEIHENLDYNTQIKAIENQGYNIMNLNHIPLPTGCTDPDSCNYDSNAIVDDNSCAYLVVTETISGSSQSSYFSTETYTYPLDSENEIQWSVEGGEILSGQGTNTLVVRWHFESQSYVHAVISNSTCSSEELTLSIQLDVNNLSEDISVARLWNEALLFAIRKDFARPTVHARNLFHTSAAMYDAWAIYNETDLYLLGNMLNGINVPFNGFTVEVNTLDEDIRRTISYTAYRLLSSRFFYSPNQDITQEKFDLLMNQLGYNINFTDLNYESGDAAALGNYIAQMYIDYGLEDGSREITQYDNAYYLPVNEPLAPVYPGNPTISNPNRWQSLSLDTYIDQSGNLIEGSTIDFLGPEWGNVFPFAMTESDKVGYSRDGDNYWVYNDPSDPPYLDNSNSESSEVYKWGFSMVSAWSSHLDPFDGVMWDISPTSIGNIDIANFPTTYADYPNFYDFNDGGDISQGHAINPATGNPYEPQIVPRGDYARILAEFWADGPDSETPPGHWFTLLNYVSDNPLLEKRFNGQGSILNSLEWDIKAYFTLGGGMHDAAISAWSVKGWYDFIRPISALRYMGDMGQSTDSELSNYHEDGIPLFDGLIEVVEEGDPLVGIQQEHLNKIKVYAWKGHSYINDTEVDQSGVGWILLENWWPYQRPSFVTPPFAGYVSGHSTYSRAAAEIITLITGDDFFPGGMGEFVARKNEFLVFEEGPSVDVTLQWATYRDASDQCSLSRIWGGIHPPCDDIPGRLMGETIGVEAYNKAITYFDSSGLSIQEEMELYPNPILGKESLSISNTTPEYVFYLYDVQGKELPIKQEYNPYNQTTQISINDLITGVYILRTGTLYWKVIVL